MASPFPGMDPYLESAQLWPEFQRNLLGCLNDVLHPSLSDRYRLRTGTRLYAIEQALLVSVIREEFREEYLEIRQRATGRLITLIDMVSPANRTTALGRQQYQAKRQEVRRAGAHLVELDLVLQGQSCLDFPSEGLPEWDYAVSVSRLNQPSRPEVYTLTLQKRLPRFRLPLASDDRDLVVDLQVIFTRCYDQFFAGKIDYQKDPPAVLKDADWKWADALLRQQQVR